MSLIKAFVFCILYYTVSSSFCIVAQTTIKHGIWRGVLQLNEELHRELPFNFEVKKVGKNTQLIMHNAEERITVTEITASTDSFNFKMPIFDSEFKCKLLGDTLLTGVWINHAKTENNIIPFNAKYGVSQRFLYLPGKSNPIYEGRWEVTFSKTTKDSSKAIGLFTHLNGGSYVTGTFLTETGDYRYLEGMVSGGKIHLSCFDGSHAFLFTAENNGQEITNGYFYSGKTWEEPWIGKRNDSFQLKNPETITQLKSEFEKITFEFLNLQNKKVSLNDARFKNKPVVIEIMGSWCPNCMDETSYLAGIYKRYAKQGLEIIGLSYERTSDFEKAKNNITRLKSQLHANYEVLITGLTGKDKASESLPFLNKISAFPTTIILDKNHHVKTIYTGFSGPATGKAYEAFKFKFETTIADVLK